MTARASGGEGARPARSRRRVAAPVAGAVLLALLGLGTLAGPALGHASLERTDPPDGLVLPKPPREIHLWFSESVLVGASSFSLVDADGRAVRLDQARAADAEDTELVVSLPALPTNTFRLEWLIVSADDLHVSSGSVVFGVAGTAGLQPTAAEAAARPEEAAAGWLGFASIAGLIGALIIGRLLPATAPDPTVPAPGADPALWADTALARARRRLRVLAFVSAAVGAAASLLAFAVKATALGSSGGPGVPLSVLLDTGPGLRSLATAVVLAGTAVVLARPFSRPGPGRQVRPDRSRPSRWRRAPATIAIAGLGTILAVLRALSSHSAGANDPLGLAVGASAMHVLAAAAWIGGLVALTVAVTPLLEADPGGRVIALATLRRFGWLAAACVGATAVTGLVVGGALVASVDALLVAGYGHLLMLKVGLAGCVALLGLANAVGLHPSLAARIRNPFPVRLPGRRSGVVPPGASADARSGSRRLAGRVRVEAAGALAVAAVAATLTATPPAVGPAWTLSADAATQRGGQVASGSDAEALASSSGMAGDLIVTYSIRPNRPGRNFLTVSVYDTRRPSPGRVEQVLARLRDAAPGGAELLPAIVLAPAGDRRYEAILDLAGDDPLDVSIVTERTGLADAVYSSGWTVLAAVAPSVAAAAPAPVIVSREPLKPVFDRTAAVLGLTLAGLLAVAIRARRRSPIPEGSAA